MTLVAGPWPVLEGVRILFQLSLRSHWEVSTRDMMLSVNVDQMILVAGEAFLWV